MTKKSGGLRSGRRHGTARMSMFARLRRPSPAVIIAIVALVMALGGSAVAASRYIITSTSQIKPSVLRA
jgi:hypothetical protein